MSESKPIHTVSSLMQAAKNLLEDNFPSVWLQGEISNFARPASGHWYFTLKDDHAQCRAAMFRQSNRQVSERIQQGDEVLVKARISLYTPRGDFQLIIEHLEPAGKGALQRRFDALKKTLAAKGYFDPAHKLPLPLLPRCIGVITSPSGAAIRDILSVLQRRFPSMPVIIYPTLVQGSTAAAQIVAQIQRANARAECDVLILARGGGSLEDLWPFNEAAVVEAIFHSAIPMISGVGHETDITLSDLVADVRAATPTAAAQTATPEQAVMVQQLSQLIRRQQHAIWQHVNFLQQRLDLLKQRLPAPGQYAQLMQHRLQRAWQSLDYAMHTQLQQEQTRLRDLQHRLHAQTPKQRFALYQRQLQHDCQQLYRAMRQQLQQRQQQLHTLSRTLHATSPLATLGRGFTLVSDAQNQQLITSRHAVTPGMPLQLRFHDGACQVTADVQQATPTADLITD